MWGRVDVDIMINYLALQDESYHNMLRILKKRILLLQYITINNIIDTININ